MAARWSTDWPCETSGFESSPAVIFRERQESPTPNSSMTCSIRQGEYSPHPARSDQNDRRTPAQRIDRPWRSAPLRTWQGESFASSGHRQSGRATHRVSHGESRSVRRRVTTAEQPHSLRCETYVPVHEPRPLHCSISCRCEHHPEQNCRFRRTLNRSLKLNLSAVETTCGRPAPLWQNGNC